MRLLPSMVAGERRNPTRLCKLAARPDSPAAMPGCDPVTQGRPAPIRLRKPNSPGGQLPGVVGRKVEEPGIPVIDAS
jgi:hypothetical protein